MSVAVIEINDAGIVTFHDDRIQDVEPACAVLDNQQLLLGNAAFDQTRLKPSWTNDRFWSQLSMDPLTNGTKTIRHHADLAYAQLDAIWQPLSGRCDEVIFAVPGTFQKPQLALLLGICKELSIPVRGLVDSAVAAASEQAAGKQLLHLDAQLHRIVLTTFDQGARLQRAGVVVIAETGLTQLRNRWANVISDVFVRATRFDPMHGAESEQALYSQLPAWLEEVAKQEASDLELEVEGGKHTVTIQKDQLVGGAADIYPKIVEQIRSRIDESGCNLLLSSRLNGFPGLNDTLALLQNCQVTQLSAAAAATGTLDHYDHIVSSNENISFVTSVPWTHDHDGHSVGFEDLTPTHLVYKGRAKPITGSGIDVGLEAANDGFKITGLSKGISRKHCTIRRDGNVVKVEDHSSFGTYLNDIKVTEASALQAGDVLRLGEPGEELMLITLVH